MNLMLDACDSSVMMLAFGNNLNRERLNGVIVLTILHRMEERRKEMFYLTMHSTHFIYGYMASDIW